MFSQQAHRALKLAVLVLVLVTYSTSQAQREFSWADEAGNVRSLSDLQAILQQHQQWITSEKKSGTRADLSGANLKDAHLDHANLTGAELAHANLNGADLIHAVLIGADLTHANLSNAKLDDANLNDAELTIANLTNARLMGTHLNGAGLMHTNLTHADLTAANLRGAKLFRTDLTYADLTDTNLSGAEFVEVNLYKAVFEPKSLPELREISGAMNLEFLTYTDNPDSLFQLRKQFEDNGFREPERKITYALKRRETQLSCERCLSRELSGEENRAILWSSDSTLANCGSFVLNRVFFDWTCQYGMSPGRPLMLGVLLWLLCSLLYFVFLHTHGEAGLYRVYGTGICDDPKAPRRAERILPPGNRWSKKSRSVFHMFWDELLLMRTSMFFSLMSAFNIGFRDINFGRWLRLLTRQEFDIKAVGWTRVVAGWQSLISVFLVALWVLTYFGRPF